MRKCLFAITLIFSLLNCIGGSNCPGPQKIRTEWVYADRKHADALKYKSNLTRHKKDNFYEVKKNFTLALIIQDRLNKVLVSGNLNVQNRFQIPVIQLLSKTIPLSSKEDIEQFA